MGLTIHRPEKEYTILDALNDLATKKRKGVLMLIHKEHKTAYKVRTYNPATSMVVLAKPGKRRVAPIHITEREAKLYSPMWRG